ncbi:hypothetical protein R1sor_007474 [Riccia sorocarpa]|uniref:Uncharacterized protein n=1 Tax=Riccia sorocarpa TaxID=122646 RepID=A0ABD3HQY2_9MARC
MGPRATGHVTYTRCQTYDLPHKQDVGDGRGSRAGSNDNGRRLQNGRHYLGGIGNKMNISRRIGGADVIGAGADVIGVEGGHDILEDDKREDDNNS